MLRNINSLTGFKIHATDGELGHVAEFYFDDRTWDIRYMVVKTGGWLSGRKVLISPAALKTPDWKSKSFPVALTLDQVRNSPDIDTEKTVTLQHEADLHRHYAWPIYWGDGFYAGSMSGGTLYPPTREEEEEEEKLAAAEEVSHLQSTRTVAGYRVHATDGLIGHVEDFIVEEGQWIIRYLVAGTAVWLPGRKVLVSPGWIENVDWETSEVFVYLSKEEVKDSPVYNPSGPLSPDYISRLHDHYGRPRPGETAEHAEVGARGRKD